MSDAELTAIALDTALERLQAGAQAVRAGLTDQLLLALHSAKGLCGQLGEEGLAHRLHAIEDAVLDHAGIPIDTVADQIAEVHKVLSRRITDGRDLRTVPAAALLARVERDLAQTARRRAIAVLCEVDAHPLDIPGQTAGLLLDLFGHLTRNAVVHGESAGHVRIRLQVTGDGEQLHAAVSDSGTARAVASRSVDLDAGRGLGMAAVHARLAEIGGRCEVIFSSDGSTVRMFLPFRW